ncbi:hypothetical protein Tco_1121644 [Tanacetum coccineum]|uniref:Uncharacterized protein n=1 Tax=Tanacetum coccineum TaxID=301880 RepID=A0ABQ5IY95_9ASTR
MLAIQAEEGEGSGHPSEPQPPPSTAQPIHEEPIPNVVSSSHQKTQTPRQALNQVTELPQTSEPIPNVPDEAVYEEWDDRVERATTTAASLDAAQASGGSPRCQEAMGGSIAQTRSERVPTPPHDSPLPRVNTLGSDEGSMSLQELTVLCTKLFSKVESLEADLKQTKQVYGAAYTKLIMKGRMIEEIDQDAGVTLVTPTHSQEDQPEDQLGVFSAAKVLADAAKNVHAYTRRRRAVSTSSNGISTNSILFSTAEESVSTAGASMLVNTAGTVQEVNKDKDPQWKYLSFLLHCLSPKRPSWNNLGQSLLVLITPLTPSMLEVVTALAAEEEHSTSPHSRAASSARDAQMHFNQSAAHSQRNASVKYCFLPWFTATSLILMCSSQWSASTFGERSKLTKQRGQRKKHKKKSSVKLGRNKDEDNAVTTDWKEKVMRMKKLILRRKIALM